LPRRSAPSWRSRAATGRPWRPTQGSRLRIPPSGWTTTFRTLGDRRTPRVRPTRYRFVSRTLQRVLCARNECLRLDGEVEALGIAGRRLSCSHPVSKLGGVLYEEGRCRGVVVLSLLCVLGASGPGMGARSGRLCRGARNEARVGEARRHSDLSSTGRSPRNLAPLPVAARGRRYTSRHGACRGRAVTSVLEEERCRGRRLTRRKRRLTVTKVGPSGEGVRERSSAQAYDVCRALNDDRH
jgi:hypothetical protein